MIDITKLKMGNRVQFSPKSYGQITNYEIDISNLKGTVKTDRYSDDVESCWGYIGYDHIKETVEEQLKYLEKEKTNE